MGKAETSFRMIRNFFGGKNGETLQTGIAFFSNLKWMDQLKFSQTSKRYFYRLRISEMENKLEDKIRNGI